MQWKVTRVLLLLEAPSEALEKTADFQRQKVIKIYEIQQKRGEKGTQQQER